MEVEKMKTVFEGVDPDKDYTIRVCTIVNGRSIAQRNERVKAIVQPDSQMLSSQIN